MPPAAPRHCQPLQGEGVWGHRVGSCCHQPGEPEITHITPLGSRFCLLGVGTTGATGMAWWQLCSGSAALWGIMSPGDFWEVLNLLLGFPPHAQDPLESSGVKSPGWELMPVGLGTELGQHPKHPIPSQASWASQAQPAVEGTSPTMLLWPRRSPWVLGEHVVC